MNREYKRLENAKKRAVTLTCTVAERFEPVLKNGKHFDNVWSKFYRNQARNTFTGTDTNLQVAKQIETQNRTSWIGSRVGHQKGKKRTQFLSISIRWQHLQLKMSRCRYHVGCKPELGCVFSIGFATCKFLSVLVNVLLRILFKGFFSQK